MKTGTFIAVVAVASLGALGAVVANFVVGGRLFEETVVKDPYEAGLRYQKLRPPEPRRAPGVDCDIDRGPCEKAGPGDLRIELEIGPRPVRAMADLQFTIRAWRGAEPLAGQIGQVLLQMPGMYMGENRVALTAQGGGSYQGKGLLVRCPTGKRVWSAEVMLRPHQPGEAAPLTTSFTFELSE